jgi:anti-sigma factor RsiW
VPSWSKENWHPSEDELFCYVDGALKPGESQRLKTHLEACWTCRVKAEKIQANIASFVSLLDRAVTQEDDLRLPPRQWRTFDAKVRKVMAESGKPSLLYRWSASFRDTFFSIYLPFRLVGGLALLLTLVALALRFHQTASVSASELLHNAVEAEVHQIRTPTQPVVYQKLQVRRKTSPPMRDDVVTWEIWNDSSSGRFTHRAAGNSQQFSHVPLERLIAENGENRRPARTGSTDRPSESGDLSPILLELGQIFQANRLDGRKPLSPSNYESWRKAVERKAEQVEERDLSNGGKGLVLSTNPAGPFAPNSIIQADLVVRVEDWHPVAEILRIQGNEEVRDYELTETDFDLLALNSLSPGIFSDITLPTTRSIPQTAITPQAAAPAGAELTASEIMVRYALHRAKACLGEPVEILVKDLGGIEVRGLAETPERKQDLIAALQDIPLVTVRIQSVAEAQAAMAPAKALKNSSAEANTSTSEEASAVTVRAGKLPIQDGLNRYFAQGGGDPNSPGGEKSATDIHQRIVALSSQAMFLADANLADAFALRELAEKYPLGKTRSLQASSRWLLETMIREHIQSIRATTIRSGALLDPVLRWLEAGNEKVADSKEVEEIAATSDWAGQVLQLFRTIKRMERLTAFLFAGANLPEEQEEQAVAKLLATFKRIDLESHSLADPVNRPDRSESATLASDH